MHTKNRKNDPFNRKNGILKKKSKVFNFLWYKVFSTQISHSQVNNCDRQLENKRLLVLYKEKLKNAYKKRKNENFDFFLMSQGSLKLVSYVKRCALQLVYRYTDRMTTVGTLSGFKDFFLQPIIKDRSNKRNTELVWAAYTNMTRK